MAKVRDGKCTEEWIVGICSHDAIYNVCIFVCCVVLVMRWVVQQALSQVKARG